MTFFVDNGIQTWSRLVAKPELLFKLY